MPQHPATLSRCCSAGVLREGLGYDGVVITDALMMKAVHERYGHGARRGADAAGRRRHGAGAGHAAPNSSPRCAAIDAAQRDGAARSRHGCTRRRSASTRWRTRYPAAARAYDAAQRAADEALMRRRLGARAHRRRRAASRRAIAPLRVVTQADVPSDGVSEAGLPARRGRARCSQGFADVELLRVPDLAAIDCRDACAARRPPHRAGLATIATRYAHGAAPGGPTCTWRCGIRSRCSTSPRRPW